MLKFSTFKVQEPSKLKIMNEERDIQYGVYILASMVVYLSILFDQLVIKNR